MDQVLNFLVGIVGVVFFWFGALAYPDEVGRLKDRLEGWWIQVDDLRAQGLRSTVALLRVAAERTSRWLTKLYGPGIMTVDFVGASLAISIGLMSFALGLVRTGIPSWVRGCYIFSAFACYKCFAILLTAETPDNIRRSMLGASLLGVGAAFGIGFLLVPSYWRDLFDIGWAFGEAVVVSIMIDLGYVALTRKTLLWISEQQKLFRILLLGTNQLLLGVVVFVIPFLLLPEDGQKWPSSGYLLLAMRAWVVFIALALFGLSGLALIHRLLWAAVTRPIYAVAGLDVLRFRKLFLWTGLVLVAVAFPPVRDLLRTLNPWR
jgi:hypothetical protein